MANCYSNYLRDKINDLIHGGVAFTPPATTYFALMTTLPNAANTGGVECTGGNMARASLANNGTNWNASSSQAKTNATAISWGTLNQAFTGIVGVAEYDAPTGGNLLTVCQLASPASINSGQPFSIPPASATFAWSA